MSPLIKTTGLTFLILGMLALSSGASLAKTSASERSRQCYNECMGYNDGVDLCQGFLDAAEESRCRSNQINSCMARCFPSGANTRKGRIPQKLTTDSCFFKKHGFRCSGD